MADWLEITTAFKDPETGSTLSGFLYATLLETITLAGGGIVPAFRRRYTVTAGQAKQPDATNLELPVTVDADPPEAVIYVEIEDSQGRNTALGSFVVPRPDPFVATSLESLL